MNGFDGRASKAWATGAGRATVAQLHRVMVALRGDRRQFANVVLVEAAVRPACGSSRLLGPIGQVPCAGLCDRAGHRDGDRGAGRVIDANSKVGTPAAGAPGDVAIMELVEGPASFVGTGNSTRNGQAFFKPQQTLINGARFGRPCQPPFPVR